MVIIENSIMVRSDNGMNDVKEKKTELRIYTIADWEKEARYLQKRHREGWKFVRINLPGFYHFEQCVPEDVVYQLDYGPEDQEHKEKHVQMSTDRGWEYIQEFGGYLYFRKPRAQLQGEKDSFCDDRSRLEMMKRMFAGRYLPLLIVLMLLIVPNLFEQSQSAAADAPVLTVLFVILFAIYAWALIVFGRSYWKLNKRLRK